jgi:hypothetical protein
MASPAQTQANQANAQQSTGPVTSEGKAKMFANPLRHGLTSKHLLIPGETQADFDTLLADLRSLYRPTTPPEQQLLAQVAEHYWRLLRTRRVETATLSLFIDRLIDTPEAAGDPDRALALAFERYGRELDRLRRYETTIDRLYRAARTELELCVNTRLRIETCNIAAIEAKEAAAANAIGSVSQHSGASSSGAAARHAPPAVQSAPALRLSHDKVQSGSASARE